MPGPASSVTDTVAEQNPVPNLTIAVPGDLDACFQSLSLLFDHCNSTVALWKLQTSALRPARVGITPGKTKGADPTHPHERHREAPLREARRAAPDGARATAVLFVHWQNSRFSRGTEPRQAKVVVDLLHHGLEGGSAHRFVSTRFRPSRQCRARISYGHRHSPVAHPTGRSTTQRTIPH